MSHGLDESWTEPVMAHMSSEPLLHTTLTMGMSHGTRMNESWNTVNGFSHTRKWVMSHMSSKPLLRSICAVGTSHGTHINESWNDSSVMCAMSSAMSSETCVLCRNDESWTDA